MGNYIEDYVINCDGVTCCDIAEDIQRFYGTGVCLEVRESTGAQFRVQEKDKVSTWEYHTVYLVTGMIYDLRLSRKPIPKGEFQRSLNQLNEGKRFIYKEYSVL